MGAVRRRGKFRRRIPRVLAVLALGWFGLTVLLTGMLRWVRPPTSSYMLQAGDGPRLLGAPDARIRYRWTDSEQISAHVTVAVVAAEDQKFPVHHGFDLASIQEAMRQNLHRRSPRGASTISQQVAKNLFLWPGRSLVRKGLEAYFTVLIELLWPKRRILEVYLNIAQFGPGIFGVGSASEIYFHKPPSRLDGSEAALLAAVLPNPKRLSLANPSKYVRLRARSIQEEAEGLGGPAYLKGIYEHEREKQCTRKSGGNLR